MREAQIQIPEECQHEAGNNGLKHELLAGEDGPDHGKGEADGDDDQNHAGQRRERCHERGEPQGNSWMRCRELAGTTLVADFGIARIGMPVRTELEIIRASAEVAEQRLAGSDSMTLVAVAHKGF